MANQGIESNRILSYESIIIIKNIYNFNRLQENVWKYIILIFG